MAARSVGEHAGRAGLAVDPVGVDDARVDRGALDDASLPGRGCRAETSPSQVSPRSRAARGRHDHVSGSMPSFRCSTVAQPVGGVRSSSTSRASCRAVRRSRSARSSSSRSSSRRCSITSGTPPARKTLDRRVADRSVRQGVDESRHSAVDAPSSRRRSAASSPRCGRRPGCAAAGSSTRRTRRARSSRSSLRQA